MQPAESVTVPVPVGVCLVILALCLLALAWPPLGNTVAIIGRIAWLYLVTGAQG